MIGPIYQNLSSKKYSDDIGFGKVDIDENADAAAEYDIRGVPTFISTHEKEIVGRFTGADQGKLEELIETLEKA